MLYERRMIFEEDARGHVLHYYGDYVRILFVCAAAAMLIGVPFYGNWLHLELPFVVVGAAILVALAAISNPYRKSIHFANSVAAGVGMVLYEIWALYAYAESTWLQFSLRQLIAILFLVAFYFSMKTVRAFLLHQVGKHDQVGDFDQETEISTWQRRHQILEREKEFD